MPGAQAATSNVRDAATWLRARLQPDAGLVGDSRALASGDAFFAYPGERTDGRHHIEGAIAAGAAAVLWESKGFDWNVAWAVPNLGFEGLRRASGPIADAYYDAPSSRMDVIAVTGTNGKTSCSQWIAQALEWLGVQCAAVGTLGAGRPGALETFGLTTPDALALQRLLARFAGQRIGHAAIEASSIGLDQDRLAGTRLHTAVFTNLSRDHLDYHGSLQAYAQAKSRLFAWPGLACAVVNLDDPAAPQMLAAARDAGRRIGYAFATGGVQFQPLATRHGPHVDQRLLAVVEPLDDGLRLAMDGDFGRAEARLSLVGRFNAANALAVAAACLAQGHGLDRVVAALEALAPVPGRMQTVALPGQPLVVVDYAHAPAALEQVLEALRPLALHRGGALWCLFGAGGDRDRGKRPLMGGVAEAGADHVVLTSDNPRSESPQAIVDEIATGMRGRPRWVECDRRLAIERAIFEADAPDTVLVAGKGHERYQEIGGERLPFSDAAVAAAALGARAAGAGGVDV
ncbi:MAG: UDP-N-acetylmuramoyl-L-alanyl-D-glutamate--2,6-diaminopimelate ligase [Burkholderiales bacterium]|nr:MAG: UDP-N-acetylmuramoyl-L-alanyl-D-glutamate--2,6-diaminopimelate ligase [Burkholderiales bacterium]